MIGTTISHYRILEQLGKGGMGVVYKAEDTRLHRPVALKFLPPGLSGDDDAKQRFMQEARAASALDHSNICSIFDIGEAPVAGTGDSQLFIVMAFYDGNTLKYRLQDGPLSVDESVDIAAQVAAGLQRAHEAGIVHRDIKPANIMVTDRGEAKILDFGVAKLVGGQELTKAGSTLGTAAYMSPEQARSEPVDHRADLWSVGVILYEMLTGRRPFEGDYDAAIAYSILNAEPAPIEGLRPGIPDSVSSAVHRLLSKNPKDRFQSAAEVLAALRGSDGLSTIRTRPKVDSAAHGAHRRRYSKVAAWAMACLAILAAAVFGLRALKAGEEPAESAIPLSEVRRAIAVLPFTDLSPARDSEYMGDGIAEELIYALSKLQNLQVAARTSSFSFKGRNEDISSIAEQLNVDLVLDGSIRRDGEALRVTAELVNAADGFQVWSERYDRRVDDVFAVQEDITRSIVEALELELTGSESTRLNQHGTTDLEAYTLYLRGRQQWNLRTREGLANAIELLKQAIDRDPGYARAFAGLADAYSISADWGYMDGRKARDSSLAAAEQAVRLDPGLAEGYVALAIIEGQYDRKFEKAISLFEKGLDLDPSYATGHQWFSELLSGLGRCEESTDHMKRALELDPLSPIINSNQVMPYLCNHDYEGAERVVLRAIDLFPDFALNRMWLAQTYLGMGDIDRAAEAVEGCPSPDCLGVKGMILGLRGRKDDALLLLKTPEIINSGNLRPILEAWIYTGCGRLDDAFNLLRQAIPGANSYLLHIRQMPVFAPLRSDQQYGDLLVALSLSEVH